MAHPLADVFFKAHLDTAGIPAEARKVAAETNNIFKEGIKHIAVGLIGVEAVREGFKLVIEGATKLQEAMDRVHIAAENAGIGMGTLSPALKKATDEGAKLGFSAIEITKAYGTLITSSRSASEATKELGQAEDLARFKGISLTDAAHKMALVHAGSTRALKDLGINLAANASAAEKNRAITEALGRIQGQGAGYAETLAGKEEILKAQFENAAAALGGQLIPKLSESMSFIIEHGKAIAATVLPIVGLYTAWKTAGLALKAFNGIMELSKAIRIGGIAAILTEAGAERAAAIAKAQATLATTGLTYAQGTQIASTLASLGITAEEAVALGVLTAAEAEAAVAALGLAAAEDVATGGLALIIQGVVALVAALGFGAGAYALFGGSAKDTTKELLDNKEAMAEVSDAMAEFGLSKEDAMALVGAGKSLSEIQNLKFAWADATEAVDAYVTKINLDVKDTGKAVEKASQGLKDAQQGVIDAQKGVVEAIQGVKNAEATLTKDQIAAKTAQKDLTQARKDAADQLEALHKQIRDIADTEEEASLRLQQAQHAEELTRGLDPRNTDRRAAVVGLSEAQKALNDLKEADNKLVEKGKDADKKGIEGSDLVLAAKQKIIDANAQVLKDEESIAKARDAVATAERGVEAAVRGVSGAQDTLNDAVDKHAEALFKQKHMTDENTKAGREYLKLLNDQKDASEAFHPGEFDKDHPGAPTEAQQTKSKGLWDRFLGSLNNMWFNWVQHPIATWFGQSLPGYFTDTKKNGPGWTGFTKQLGNEWDNWIAHPIGHWFGTSLPGYFTDTTKNEPGWTGFLSSLNNEWHNWFIDPIEHWFTVSLPDFFTKSLPAAASAGMALFAVAINGITSGINAITSPFGIPPIPPISFAGGGVITSFAQSAPTPAGFVGTHPGNKVFASGGMIHGPGTGTSDDVPIWGSKGEYIVRAAAVDKLGLNFMDWVNNIDKHGGTLLSGDPSAVNVRFATGGLVGSVQDWLRNVADPLPYVFGAAGPGAFDCSGLVGEVWARLTGHPTNHRYMSTGTEQDWATKAGFQPGRGKFTIGWNDSHTMGSLDGLPFEAANPRSGIRVGGGTTDVTSFPHVMYLKELGAGFIQGIGNFLSGIGSSVKGLPAGLIHKFAQPLLDNLRAKGVFGSVAASSIDSIIESILGGGTSGTTGGDTGDANVAAIAARTGKSMGADSKAMLALFEAGLVESGMRNLLVATDHDSLGYLQQRPSQGWPNPTNVETATRSFLSRAMSHEPWAGSAGSLAQKVQVSAFPARYDQRAAQAQQLLSQFGFDNGGWLQPGPLNTSGRPEAVLTADESAGLKAAVKPGAGNWTDSQMRYLAVLIAQALSTRPSELKLRDTVISEESVHALGSLLRMP